MNSRDFTVISTNAEAELLVHCARLKIDASRAARIKTLLSSALDWDRLISLAERNGLVSILCFQLEQIAREHVPPDRLAQLRDRFHSNSALNVLLTAELVRLLDLFERNQIAAIPYKGPALAARVYGKLSLRQFSDLDILVREADVWKATELLIDQDYRAHFVIPARKQSKFIRLGYVRLFKRERDHTPVELHWRLAPRFFGASFDTSQLWQHTETIEVQGASMHVPCPEDLLLMLCIHGAKDCWEKLEWVCALAELVQSNPHLDWQELMARAKASRCLAIVSLGLLLAHDLLDAPLPSEVIKELTRRKRAHSVTDQVVTRFFADNPEQFTLARRIRFHLQLKDSRRDRFLYCLRLGLTTTPVDWEMTSLPESASFLYYPLRALRLVRKYGWETETLTASD